MNYNFIQNTLQIKRTFLLISALFILFSFPAEARKSGIFSFALNSFKAFPSKNNISLEWQSPFEMYNNYYVIERSADGLDFSSLDTVYVKAGTISAVDYKYIDQKPLPQMAYYRLQMVDKENQMHYSKILNVQSRKNTIAEDNDFKVWPVPFRNELQIKTTGSSKDILVQLYNAAGKNVYQANRNFNGDVNQFSLNGLQHLPPGVYLLTIKTKETYTQRMVIKSL